MSLVLPSLAKQVRSWQCIGGNWRLSKEKDMATRWQEQSEFHLAGALADLLRGTIPHCVGPEGAVVCGPHPEGRRVGLSPRSRIRRTLAQLDHGHIWVPCAWVREA